MKQIVRHGTPDHGENLCDTCSSAMKRQGHRISDMEIYCHAYGDAGPTKVPFPVAECSVYRDKRLVKPDAFYGTAWYYIPDYGWIPPDKYRKLVASGKVK